MYIRRTSTRNNNTGDPYFTYRLVESVRTATGVRQITVLNLGSDFTYPRELWPDIAGRIDEILHGEMRLFGLPKDIEAAAQNYAAKIIRVRNSSSEKQEYSNAEPEYHIVDINSLQTIRPRTVSIEHVSYYAARQLELDYILNELGLNPHDKNAVLGVIIGRMVAPGSELATHFWLQNQTGLGEIIGCDYQAISLARIYRAADLLVKHKEVLEQHLYNRQKFLFKFEETITLYDLTNTYFEGSGKFNTLAGRGHSKEKRTDCPLVAFGLILDGSGFPKRSEVFEGNISEPKTLEKMIKSLQKKSVNETNEEKQQPLLASSNPVIVMDAGIATEENVQWLKTNNYPYLVVSRKQHLEFCDEKSVVVKIGVDSTVRVYKVVNAETNEIEIYCHSTGREAKEKGIQDRFTTRFEEELQKLALGLTKKGCVKKYDKVNVKLGRLKEKYSKAAKNYIVTIEKDKESENVVKITWERKVKPDSSDAHPGVYCLRTNVKTLNVATLWRIYTMLTDLEAVFRSLKSELGFRPVFHQIARRVSGHLLVSLFAYHLVHTIRYQLKEIGIHLNWDSLRRQLRGQDRITTVLRKKNGKTIHIRKSTTPEPRHCIIYDALGLPHFPGKTEKTIV